MIFYLFCCWMFALPVNARLTPTPNLNFEDTAKNDERPAPFLLETSSAQELRNAVRETRSLIECIQKNCDELEAIEKRLEEIEKNLETDEPEVF